MGLNCLSCRGTLRICCRSHIARPIIYRQLFHSFASCNNEGSCIHLYTKYYERQNTRMHKKFRMDGEKCRRHFQTLSTWQASYMRYDTTIAMKKKDWFSKIRFFFFMNGQHLEAFHILVWIYIFFGVFSVREIKKWRMRGKHTQMVCVFFCWLLCSWRIFELFVQRAHGH